MDKELRHDILCKVAIAPQVGTNNTAMTGNTIDTDGYESLTFIIATGTLSDADATFAVTFEHGDNSALSDTAVPAADDLTDVVSTAINFTFEFDNKCKWIGYIGKKRYVRMTITPSANDSGNIPIAAIAVLGHPKSAPTTMVEE